MRDLAPQVHGVLVRQSRRRRRSGRRPSPRRVSCGDVRMYSRSELAPSAASRRAGADDGERCLVQAVEAALVEHRHVRAAAAGALELGAHIVIEQTRAAHLVAQPPFGEARLEPLVRGSARRPTTTVRVEHGPGDRERPLHLHAALPLRGRPARPATRMPRAAAARAAPCRGRAIHRAARAAARRRPTRSSRPGPSASAARDPIQTMDATPSDDDARSTPTHGRRRTITIVISAPMPPRYQVANERGARVGADARCAIALGTRTARRERERARPAPAGPRGRARPARGVARRRRRRAARLPEDAEPRRHEVQRRARRRRRAAAAPAPSTTARARRGRR